MTASTTAAVEALTAAQNAFADLPMPPAHGAARPSTLADLAALHFDALARLLGHYADAVDPVLARLSTAELAALLERDPFGGPAPQLPAGLEAQLDRDFGADRPPSVYADEIPGEWVDRADVADAAVPDPRR